MMPVIVVVLLSILVGCVAPRTFTPETPSELVQAEAEKQQILAVEAFVDAERRLHRIGYSLLASGVPLCDGIVLPTVGMTVWNSLSFTEEWQQAMQTRYGLTEAVEVSNIFPGSPAKQAGIKAGDKLIALAGWLVPSGPDAVVQFKRKMNRLLQETDTIELLVQREGQNLTMILNPIYVCGFDVVLDNSDIKNAYADGEKIVVHRGMMDFFDSDQEVALVVAHELAHNALKHIEAKKKNALFGGVVGFVVDSVAAAGGLNTRGQFTDLGLQFGAMSYSVEFEKEADYVGLYFMALAGYEIDGAADFWRRIAIQNPKSIGLRVTHPTTPERFVGIEKTISEIKNKIANNQALEPELRLDPQ